VDKKRLGANSAVLRDVNRDGAASIRSKKLRVSHQMLESPLLSG
jgi:hypothetical protein